MKVVRTVAEMKAWRAALASERRVAMVPTMGSLHAGHLSLLNEARRRVLPEAGDLVISIFVNPTQFGPNEDLDAYPRDEAGDLEKAVLGGVDVAFCPVDPRELFPPDAVTWVEVGGLQDILCGRTRPGHFRGVCTVCTKLWTIIRPHVSVFGRKDFQQLTILRRMHDDLHLSGEIVGAPIVREPDGLAMSSRNINLSVSARGQAQAIFRLLQRVQARFAEGQRSVVQLLEGAEAALAPGRLDYVEVRDADSLAAIDVVEGAAVCAVAAWYGGVRLIDNAVLEPT